MLGVPGEGAFDLEISEFGQGGRAGGIVGLEHQRGQIVEPGLKMEVAEGVGAKEMRFEIGGDPFELPHVGAGEPAFPPGPVVATGGVTTPELPARSGGPAYPGVGGNAGNTPYPSDVTDLPPTRYMTDYGVLASYTKPPYTTLTAYDLNTGEIKWQVPNGDHPATMRAGGPANTGGLAARNGVIVLEPRFLLAGNQEVQIAGDPRDASILTHGASVVTQGAGAVPLPGFGAVFSEAEKGSNITIRPGYNFHIVPIGNLQERGPCVQHS